MGTDWRKVVTDPRHVAAFQALEDARWDWRTASAVAKASGLDALEVRRLPDLYPTLVRRSFQPSPSGQDIYTLQSKFFASQPPLQKVWTFLSGSSSSSGSSGK